MKPFVEIGSDTRIHDLEADRLGYQRNSVGITPKVGSTFEISRKLTGEISVGYVDRRYQDPRLPDVRGVATNGSLVWQATGLTKAQLTARTVTEESVLPGVSAAFRRDYALQVDHAFRRWLIGTVKLGYGHDEYVGSPRVDNRYVISTALAYKLNRNMQLKGEYRQEILRSNEPNVDYAASIWLVGLRLQN